ncbi:MAG: hypothetical protein IJ548_01715 [Paludibacteraceae bacterium]|nr:hypothetical protein [Paludibacteraceae bacterium]MBQ8705002.1 hypothetical protein [Paludibacteraceae bacterium]
MAKAKVGAAGIEYIQGALKRPKKMNGHNHGNYLVMTHRTAPTENPNCQRIYSFDGDRYDRTTQPSAKELAVRERFTEVRAMVATRRKDLNKISQDQLDFIAQKDLATGKRTMTAYLWLVCGQEYDSAHNG